MHLHKFPVKYSSILFILALSSGYIASCFAIDLKILNYQERQIGLSLSFFGLGVILAVLFHNYIREKINIFVKNKLDYYKLNSNLPKNNKYS